MANAAPPAAAAVLAALRASLNAPSSGAPAAGASAGARAAVAAVLRSVGGATPECLFIVRAASERDRWSGDVALPGGKVEPGETDAEAARREVREEVGLDLSERGGFRLLGALPPKRVQRRRGDDTTLSLTMLPFVFWWQGDSTPPLAPSSAEVAHAWWVPLSACVAAGGELPPHRVGFERLAPKHGENARRLLNAAGIAVPSVPLPPPCGLASPQPLWGLTLGVVVDLLRAASLDAPVPWDWRLEPDGDEPAPSKDEALKLLASL